MLLESSSVSFIFSCSFLSVVLLPDGLLDDSKVLSTSDNSSSFPLFVVPLSIPALECECDLRLLVLVSELLLVMLGVILQFFCSELSMDLFILRPLSFPA